MTCLASFAEKDGWQVYPAYTEAVQLEYADGKLFCIMTGKGQMITSTWTYDKAGNLVSYDEEDESVKCYDTTDGLNDVHVSLMSYNGTLHRMVLLYEDGNIDLLDTRDESSTWNLPYFMDSNIEDKSVNGISQVGIHAYLCTNFGLVDIDVKSAVIKDVYQISTKVKAVTEYNDSLLLGTSTGLYKVARTDLRDKSTWKLVLAGNVVQMASFGGRIYFLMDDYVFRFLDPANGEIASAGGCFSRFRVGSRYLIAETSNQFGVYSTDGSSKIFQQNHSYDDYIPTDGGLYAAQGLKGVLSYNYDESVPSIESVGGPLFASLNSPTRDLFYHMHYEGDRLLVAGGINTQEATYFKETPMILEADGTWRHFDEVGPRKAYPQLWHFNAVDLVQDPNDDRHFYSASYRNGLQEYRMGDDDSIKFEKFYNFENSPLRVIKGLERDPGCYNYCTCDALKFDDNGNLWMANQQTDTIVRILRPDGTWLALYYPEVSGVTNVIQYLFVKNNSNLKFFVSNFDNKGIFGFDTHGTLNDVTDDTKKFRNSFKNQRDVSYSPQLFYCMTETNDGEIWIGTSSGLFIMTDPTNWISDVETATLYQIIRNRDDGSGLADYLLDGVKVTAIAVDGANRKWIGTDGDGLYLLSDNGQETIYHFTTDNSYLISNTIMSLAVNPTSGKVMIGTDLGLCSYSEGVTEPAKSLDGDNIKIYPNPVTPDCSNIVNITNITDGAEVKILSSSGQVVWGGQSTGGSLTWDCTDMRGHHVDSGVYHVMINTKDAGSTVVKRLVVIR